MEKVKAVINLNAQIYPYSQGKLAFRPLPQGMTSRNMSKNDLWIAAQASQATLLTTDHDFNYLDGVFFLWKALFIETQLFFIHD